MSYRTGMSLPQQQSGAALVVGLIVLMIMTLLGVASMGSMTTELKMAANVQNQNTAFQVAHAAIEAAKVDGTITWLANANGIVGDPIGTQPASYVVNTGSLATAQVNIVYAGCRTVVAGNSLTGEEGGIPFLVHELQVTGQSLNSNNDVVATSTHTVGLVTVMSAGC